LSAKWRVKEELNCFLRRDMHAFLDLSFVSFFSSWCLQLFSDSLLRTVKRLRNDHTIE
jgi:hypothetical protein